MIEKFVNREKFDSYEDFKQNLKFCIPDNFNFAYDVIDEWAKIDPAKIALLWCNDFGDELKLSWTDLSLMSDKYACIFSEMGLQKGDVALLMLKRRWQFWPIILGLMKLGVAFIPATVQLTKKDIAYRCNASSASIVISISDKGVIDAIDEAIPDCTTLKKKAIVFPETNAAMATEDNPNYYSKVPLEWIDLNTELALCKSIWNKPSGDSLPHGNDCMILYFTSGTTGMPKMVYHNFTHPIGHIVTARYWQQLQYNDVHISVSDTGWAKCGWGKIYGQWIVGVTNFVYDMEKFVPALLLEKISSYHVTTFCAPPTIYRFMIHENVKDYDLSSLRMCLTAGEPLQPEVYNQWKRLTGLPITEGFGQTETTVLAANFEWVIHKPGSMGKPSPIYNIDIVDENGSSCPVGTEGNIVIRGINDEWPIGLFQSYYRDKEATDKCMYDNLYNTGDVAWKDEDGYYWFVGRSDDVIKCSGYRIGPFEVESALQEHPCVLECAVTAFPDPDRGQVVKASIVLANGYFPSEALIKELQDHVKHTTAPYKYPRIVEFLDELPKTISGKIRRVEIRNTAKSENEADTIK